MYRGDQYDFVINPKNPNGTPFDLTGYTSLFVIATERGNPSAFIGYGSASVDASADTVTCKIAPALSSQLSGTSYVYDVEILKTSFIKFVFLSLWYTELKLSICPLIY